MTSHNRQFLSLPGLQLDDHSPGSANSSAASDSSYDEQFSTPLPYLDQSPGFINAPPPPSALRRSTSAPYQPSLTPFQESPAMLQPRRLYDTRPTQSVLSEQSPHRPYLSLNINSSGGAATTTSSSSTPSSPHGPSPSKSRKSRSLSQSSASPDASAASSAAETPSPLVELSPMHKRLKARTTRAMSAGSAAHAHHTRSPVRPLYSPSRAAEMKQEDSARGEVIEVSSSGAFDYWAMDDDAMSASDTDESPTPPILAATPRYPSLRSIYRKSTPNPSSRCSSYCLPCTKPRLYRWCGGMLRCWLFTFFILAFTIFAYLLVVQFRTATLYNNHVCTPLDTSVGTATATATATVTNKFTPLSLDVSVQSPPPPPASLHSVIKTQTTLPKSKVYVVLWNMLSSFFGLFSIVRYSATSILSAVTRRIRVPTEFNSSAPLFTPNYTGSPLLQLPLNMFRFIGSHNSYHLKSSLPIPQHQYAHAPLPAQLGDYSDGVRQVELDIHILEGRGGSVIYHVQLWDDHTNCYCLTECLLLVREWSRTYTQHYPVLLMIEFKRAIYEDLSVGLNGLTCNDLYNLEVALLDVFPPGSFLLPRDVRGSFPTVQSALHYRAYLDRKTNRWNNTAASQRPTPSEDAEMAPLARYAATNVSYGWPALGALLGRVLFVWLDDVHNYADQLPCVADDPSTQQLALFIAQANVNRSYTAIQVIRKPLPEWDLIAIQRALDSGMLVRSLTTTAQINQRDTRRYEAALRVGMHVLSSDFEAPCAGNVRSAGNVSVDTSRGGVSGVNVSVASWVDVNQDDVFCERLPSGWPFECHPSLSPPWCEEELNRIRVAGLAVAEAGRMNASDTMLEVLRDRQRVAVMGRALASEALDDGW